MPELPEVETIKQALTKNIIGKSIKQVIIRNPNLRWSISADLTELEGFKIHQITRRSKYILIECKKNQEVYFVMIHLGMSGVLRVLERPEIAIAKHDHFELVFKADKSDANISLVLNDPRRFGSVFKTSSPMEHFLLKKLAPEPLSDDFNSAYFCSILNKSKSPIKQFLMNSQKVVGVGNIYANEVLFKCKLHPQVLANSLNTSKSTEILQAIKQTLQQAIELGGTTIKDFKNTAGKPGYFAQKLLVYGRENEPCKICSTKITKIVLNQRTSYFCPKCQKTPKLPR